MANGCNICGNKATEANGNCGSCNARIRKFERQSKSLNEKTRKKWLYKIPKISDKLKAELVTYARKKKEHLEKHPDCQIKLVGCQNDRKTNSVHHPAKRGKNLNREEFFQTACIYCHDQVERVMSAKERREKGLLITPKE